MMLQIPRRVAAFLACAAAVIGCNPFSSKEAAASGPASAESKPAGGATGVTADRIRVRVEKPKLDEIASYLETTSAIEAVSDADLYPKTGGVLCEVFVEEGDRVEAGQPLARLDQQEAQIQLRQAELALAESERAVLEAKLAFDESKKRGELALADADQARRDYERDAKLSESQDSTGLKIVAPKVLEASKLAWDRADSNYQVAKFTIRKAELSVKAAEMNQTKADWSLKLAKVRMDDTTIKAPFHGVVTARYVKLGETATVGTKLFKITDLDHLQTVFYRPQLDLRVLANGGQEVEATSDAIALDPQTGKIITFKGRVMRVSPVVDPLSGSFKVTASLVNRDYLLRPGLLVRIRTTLGKHENAYLIPKRARVLEGDKPFVFVVRDGATLRIPIEEGYSDADRVEIRNIANTPNAPGLRPDDSVVIIANVDLKDGLKVIVENTAASGG